MNKKSKSGFTLIEMLIVVGIIGILSSIVLVGVGRSRYAGRDARRIADLKQAQNGLELYYSKCGIYPGSATCVATNPTTWASLTTVLTNADIGVSSISDDPSAPARHYAYGVSANNQGYVLRATLEDANNAALRDDIDGTVYTVDCADSNFNYCIQF